MAIADGTINVETAGTLAGLFRERVRRSPATIAYRFYDALNETWTDYSWSAMEREVARWQSVLKESNLQVGDRVAIMARNSRFWVMFEQAALGLGLVIIPLYLEDRVDNVEFILNDANVKLLVIGGLAQWKRLKPRAKELKSLKKIISIGQISNDEEKRLVSLTQLLPKDWGELLSEDGELDDLATIVYTSGTTGQPKGVMLSHRNILSNAYSGLQAVTVTNSDVFLSFLPLSHTLERTVGYYLPMMCGATVAHARGISELAEDLQIIRPTCLISVPRIFERVYARVREQMQSKPSLVRNLFNLAIDVGWKRFNYLQGRGPRRASFILWPLLKKLVADKINEKLGGRLNIAISGGAALSPEISRVFVGLGVPILQGYGLTETSPVISVNRIENNLPASIGPPMPGIEVRIGDDDELLVRGDNVMLGYWNREEESKKVMDEEGWLRTGDKAKIEDGRIYIIGRLKEIIVMSNGEKVSPTDMELALVADTLFEQIMIVGEAKPYLTALAVLNEEEWNNYVTKMQLDSNSIEAGKVEELVLERVAKRLHKFPGYARIRHIRCTSTPWSIENDLLTPTLKIKRNKIRERYADEIESMYEEHTS